MKKVLFVCGGNTDRSPMAKAILEQMLRERGSEGEIVVDSAAKGTPTSSGATEKAREVIKQLYRKDLLAHHKSKSLRNITLDDFDLILVMEEGHKYGISEDKTYKLKEYAGLRGDIQDPYNQSIEDYRKCRDEIKDCLERAINRIINDC